MMLKQRFQMDIRAFCDNDILKQGKRINDVEVLSPWEAERCFPGGVYLVANKKYSREIQGQLSRMGIEKNRVIDCKVEKLIDGFL